MYHSLHESLAYLIMFTTGEVGENQEMLTITARVYTVNCYFLSSCFLSSCAHGLLTVKLMEAEKNHWLFLVLFNSITSFFSSHSSTETMFLRNTTHTFLLQSLYQIVALCELGSLKDTKFGVEVVFFI